MRKLGLDIDYAGIAALGYDVVREEIFHADHPSLVRWVNFFDMRMRSHRIFERFEEEAGGTSATKASVVCREWHRFSEFMPWFLCQAAAKVSTNRLRHYIIQTAFEELGGRDWSEIHHELFLRSATAAGVATVGNDPAVCVESLGLLKNALVSATSDAEILGLLLGLEIPARENIETIFESLAFDEVSRAALDASKFFRLHRQLELEHIRLTISMFLRFCHSTKSQIEYLNGFDTGIEFWKRFWGSLGPHIQGQRGERE